VHLNTKTVIIAQGKYCLARSGGSTNGSYCITGQGFLDGYLRGRNCNDVLGGYKPDVRIKINQQAFHLGADKGDRTESNANQKNSLQQWQFVSNPWSNGFGSYSPIRQLERELILIN
jgi:hypothetical protein